MSILDRAGRSAAAALPLPVLPRPNVPTTPLNADDALWRKVASDFWERKGRDANDFLCDNNGWEASASESRESETGGAETGVSETGSSAIGGSGTGGSEVNLSLSALTKKTSLSILLITAQSKEKRVNIQSVRCGAFSSQWVFYKTTLCQLLGQITERMIATYSATISVPR